MSLSNIFMKLLKYYNGYFLCRIFTCNEYLLNHYQNEQGAPELFGFF